MPSRLLTEGDRRMEAETYLSAGYGLRLAIEAQPKGWVKLGGLADIWQPSRLRGIQVGPEFGTPFLAATQVFDLRPIPRKWLALERTETANERFVEHGTILVTCSGSVGRATLAFAPHLKTFITHDLLRLAPHDQKHWGWLYAYLRAPKARAMMTGAKYGHMIKHLETSHLKALPIPTIRDELLDDFNKGVREILKLRDESYVATLAAEEHFLQCIGDVKITDSGETGFVVRASKTVFTCSNRLDASRHNPRAQTIRQHLAKRGKAVLKIAQCGFDVWVPGRYKRIPAAEGVVFVDSGELFEINPDTDKRYADCKFGDQHRGRVKPGWLLMASSGQTYGIVGGAVLATAFHEQKVLANHIIRIAPRKDATARPGYVL
ncbi:MAG TPA: hypothetical protein VMP11_18895, partial [Verrucomicrobiae bacterium]|nr:hypothetical protein [Verrucomicrobiae bacterium]